MPCDNMDGAHRHEVVPKETYKGTRAVWLNWHYVQNQIELSSDIEAKLVLNLAGERVTEKYHEEASRKLVMFHFLVWMMAGCVHTMRINASVQLGICVSYYIQQASVPL